MKRAVIGVSLLVILSLVAAAGAYNITGHVTGGDGLSYHAHILVAVSISGDTSIHYTACNPLSGYSYTLPNVDAGTYLLVAYQDIHLTILPQADDPRGFYGNGLLPVPFVLQSDTANINIALSTPRGFSGMVNYAGEQTGTMYVHAYYDAAFAGDIHGLGTILLDSNQTGNGSYMLMADSFTTYYAYAFLDVNGNFALDTDEPYGIYGSATPSPIVVSQTSTPTNVNITMHDPNAVPPSRDMNLPEMTLSAVYPNPFNNQARVSFSLPVPSSVKLALYDLLGRHVRDLAGGVYGTGTHDLTFNADGLPTGLYYLRLTAGTSESVQRVMLLK
jgi:hypothetical protein